MRKVDSCDVNVGWKPPARNALAATSKRNMWSVCHVLHLERAPSEDHHANIKTAAEELLLTAAEVAESSARARLKRFEASAPGHLQCISSACLVGQLRETQTTASQAREMLTKNCRFLPSARELLGQP